MHRIFPLSMYDIVYSVIVSGVITQIINLLAKKEVKRYFLLLRSQQYVKEKHIFFK